MAGGEKEKWGSGKWGKETEEKRENALRSFWKVVTSASEREYPTFRAELLLVWATLWIVS